MGTGMKVPRFRGIKFLISSAVKVVFISSLIVFLRKISVTLMGTDYDGSSRSLRHSSKDVDEVQRTLDVNLANAQIWSSNITYESAVISLFKESDPKVASISITTAMIVTNSKRVRVVKKGKHLSIETTGSTVQLTSSYIESMPCMNIVEESGVSGYEPSHNIDVGSALFYGGAEMLYQQWPLNYGELVVSPFLSSDLKSDENKAYGPVLERYWLTSEGAAIFVDHAASLHVGYGQSAIRFKVINSDNKTGDVTLKLNYTVCLGKDVRTTHTNLLGKLWSFPEDVPDILTFNHPIWSTKVRYQKNVNQRDVLTFVKEIFSHNFSASQLELDEVFNTQYGDWIWDESKFPKVKDMISEIHKSISCLTIAIAPFINEDAESYELAKKLGIFLKSGEDFKPAKIKWSQGTGSHVDFTSNAAGQYFMDSVAILKAIDMDSFVIDGGIIHYLLRKLKTYKPLLNPMGLCTHQVKTLRKGTSNKLMVRCGYQTQALDVFIQMLPKESTWDIEGLKSVIPSVLQYGIIGYIFFVPDVIGGNSFAKDEGTIVSGRLPDSELYIRWCQLVAFLPVMRFSVAPWDYDEETVAIVKKFVKLHDEYVTPKVIPLAHEAVQNGHPIIRPLWWVDPQDAKTFDVDSQFLIGDEVLVAPILKKGETTRSIYLPRGQWRDMNYNKMFDGPLTIYQYLAPLERIPYFERVK